MLSHKEKFSIYNEMFSKAKDLETQIRAALENDKAGYEVYTVFISVGEEETRKYFVDIEYGGSPEKYHRHRGLCTEEWLRNKFLKEG